MRVPTLREACRPCLNGNVRRFHIHLTCQCHKRSLQEILLCETDLSKSSSDQFASKIRRAARAPWTSLRNTTASAFSSRRLIFTTAVFAAPSSRLAAFGSLLSLSLQPSL
jgi:hypothetical protein